MATKKSQGNGAEPKKSAEKKKWKSDAIFARSERRPGVRSAAGLVDKLTRPAMRSRGFAQAQVLTHWGEIAGPRLAALTVPERLFKPRGQEAGGVLRLRVAGAAALELQHVTPLLIERINTYFGYRAVTRLQVVQGPIPKRAEAKRPEGRDGELPSARKELIASVTDPDLKQALEKLGRKISGKSAKG